MTTRRWFEFVSTRYHSSSSISTYPRPSVLRIAVSLFLSLSHSRSLSVALVISIRPLLSPSLYTAAGFFLVPRFVPDTRRAGPLHSLPLPSLPLLLPNASSSRDSRIGSRSTSLRLFPSLSLFLSDSLSFHLSLPHRVSIHLRPALRICFLAPVLPFSLSLLLPPWHR